MKVRCHGVITILFIQSPSFFPMSLYLQATLHHLPIYNARIEHQSADRSPRDYRHLCADPLVQLPLGSPYQYIFKLHCTIFQYILQKSSITALAAVLATVDTCVLTRLFNYLYDPHIIIHSSYIAPSSNIYYKNRASQRWPQSSRLSALVC